MTDAIRPRLEVSPRAEFYRALMHRIHQFCVVIGYTEYARHYSRLPGHKAPMEQLDADVLRMVDIYFADNDKMLNRFIHNEADLAALTPPVFMVDTSQTTAMRWLEDHLANGGLLESGFEADGGVYATFHRLGSESLVLREQNSLVEAIEKAKERFKS